MAAEVVMPRLSDSMEEGTILQWLKAVGDEVKRGDELVEIETDKANMTYEATDEGVLIEIVARRATRFPLAKSLPASAGAGEENIAAGGQGRRRVAEGQSRKPSSAQPATRDRGAADRSSPGGG